MPGGVLSQTDENDWERPIAFCSKKFNEKQKAWSTIEREVFAVLEALNRFNTWILVIRFMCIPTTILWHI